MQAVDKCVLVLMTTRVGADGRHARKSETVCTKEQKQQYENESKSVSIHQGYGRCGIFPLSNLCNGVCADGYFL